jgi:cysteine desulfurase/selenocysteine lyase
MMVSAEHSISAALEHRQLFDVDRIRKDFPLLGASVNGHPLVYLDNAATSQKPQVVIDALADYYQEYNSNIHRGVHFLSQQATDAYEEARTTIGRFINAARVEEIVFVRGATEAINLVAQSYGRKNLTAGDEVLISALEHHSNIVPWQMICEERQAVLKVIPMTDDGDLDLDGYLQLLGPRTRIVSVAHVSNALGTVNPIKTMISMAHDRGIPVLVDGAQAIPHMTVDVADLGCDFYAFSGHKMFGPTGIGVLYGKAEFLKAMPPYQGGGDMIKSVSFEKTVYNDIPHKFEAGTPNISGGIALGVAVEYLGSLSRDAIRQYENTLLDYATSQLSSIRGVRIIGNAREKASLISFILEGVHPHDVGTILDAEGIAIRTGHHCAQPIMTYFGIPATARASFALYNTVAEIDALVRGIHRVKEVFGS